jgi:hypothetical protein
VCLGQRRGISNRGKACDPHFFPFVLGKSYLISHFSLTSTTHLFVLEQFYSMSSTEVVTLSELSARPPPTPEDNAGGQDVERDSRSAGQELAPVDRGPAAWRLLFTAFVFETLLWGKMIGQIKMRMLKQRPRIPSLFWRLSRLLLQDPRV